MRDFTALATSSDTPIKPEAVIAALMNALPEDAVICADPGTPCPYFSAHYRWPVAGRHFITNRAHGALGILWQRLLARRLVGPMQLYCLLWVMVHLIFHAVSLKQLCVISCQSRCLCSLTKHLAGLRLVRIPALINGFTMLISGRLIMLRVASAFGVKSWRANKPSELRSVIAEVLSHDGPALVDIISQPLHEANAPVSEWVA